MKTFLKLAALLTLGLAVGAVWGQAAAISGQTVNQYGVPVPNSPVRVCVATATIDANGNCTPTANIFYDYGLSMAAPNPYPSDEYGNYTVYVGATSAPNLYTVQVFPADGIIWSYAQNGPFCALSGCTSSGPQTATLFNATTSPYFEVNGVQLASTNLLDTANIAYKNAANTFTGTPQTAPVWNATTRFTLNGTQIGCLNGVTGCGTDQINTVVTPLVFNTGTLSCPSCNTTNATVSSVGLTMPSWLAVAGSPVTAAGTIAVTAATAQTANSFLATPNGATGAVGLRSIANADFPASGVTAGTYPAANITVNTAGIVTSATSGTSTGTISTPFRTCGVAYHNTTGLPLYVVVVSTVGGSSGATLTATGGPTSPTITLAVVSIVAAGSGGASGSITFIVPNTFYYEVTRDTGCGISNWTETTIT